LEPCWNKVDCPFVKTGTIKRMKSRKVFIICSSATKPRL
jgi:hypothetical protein